MMGAIRTMRITLRDALRAAAVKAAKSIQSTSRTRRRA